MSVSFRAAEELSKTLSQITGFRYKVMKAKPDFPPPSDHAEWYLIAQGPISEIYHARLTWLTKDSLIRIESMYLGNTTEWIERDYGEEAAAAAINPGGSNFQSVLDHLAKQSPRESERLDAYQRILEDVSSKYGVILELTCKGGKFVATFFMGAAINVKDMREDQKAESIKRNLAALRETWDRIREYEKKREGLVTHRK